MLFFEDSLITGEMVMAVQKISVLVPPLRAVPDGAAVIADAAAWLFDRLAGWQRSLASLRGSTPAEVRGRREARERGDLIAMARRYESSQPGFAKDLYAAASVDRRY